MLESLITGNVIDPRLCTGELMPNVPHFADMRINDAQSLLHARPAPFCIFSPVGISVASLPNNRREYTEAERVNQKIGLYNIMFVNEVLDLLSIDLGGMLKNHNVLRHKLASHYNEFRRWKMEYNKGLLEYLKRQGKDFDEFSDQSDRFYELTTSKNLHFTTFQITLKNMYLAAKPVVEVDNSNDPAYHDIMIRMFILGHTFSIANQIYQNWYAYFVENYPDMYKQYEIRRFHIAPWMQLYNNILPHICSALELHMLKLNVKTANTGVSVYAKDLSSLQYTFEALEYLGTNIHNVSELGLKHPPHRTIPALSNIKTPVMTTVEEKKYLMEKRKRHSDK